MSTTYDSREHSHLTHPDLEGGCCPIIHAPGDRVWVLGCYADEMQPTWVRVGDTFSDGFDSDGDCLISIPRVECRFHTEDEATQIMAMRDADFELLSYAIG